MLCGRAGGPQHSARTPKYEQPKLIPKIIHQTYKTSSVPAAMLPYMASWRQKNSDWDVRFYDDAACLRFVMREFPEYLRSYTSLSKDVERSDFFRCSCMVPSPALLFCQMPLFMCRQTTGPVQHKSALVQGWH